MPYYFLFLVTNYHNLLNPNSQCNNYNHKSSSIMSFPSNSYCPSSHDAFLEANYQTSCFQLTKPEQTDCQVYDSAIHNIISTKANPKLPSLDYTKHPSSDQVYFFNCKLVTKAAKSGPSRSKKDQTKCSKKLCTNDDNMKRARANFQERKRMRRLNVALKELRNKIPIEFHRHPPGKNLSKIKTLKHATAYIRALTDYLGESSFF